MTDRIVQCLSVSLRGLQVFVRIGVQYEIRELKVGTICTRDGRQTCWEIDVVSGWE